jgi:hypothetical protein
MTAHGSHVGVQEAGCQMLRNLSSKSHKDKVVGAGGIEAVVAAMNGHVGDAGVQEAACVVLRKLAITPDNQAKAAAAGVIYVGAVTEAATHYDVSITSAGAALDASFDAASGDRDSKLAAADGALDGASASADATFIDSSNSITGGLDRKLKDLNKAFEGSVGIANKLADAGVAAADAGLKTFLGGARASHDATVAGAAATAAARFGFGVVSRPRTTKVLTPVARRPRAKTEAKVEIFRKPRDAVSFVSRSMTMKRNRATTAPA